MNKEIKERRREMRKNEIDRTCMVVRERERERAREQRKLVLFLMQKMGLLQRKEEI